MKQRLSFLGQVDAQDSSLQSLQQATTKERRVGWALDPGARLMITRRLIHTVPEVAHAPCLGPTPERLKRENLR